MTGNNPFEENPWQNAGPQYGNAYDDAREDMWNNGSGTSHVKMPTPGDYLPGNGWTESNKTEFVTSNSPQNAWEGNPSSVTTPQNAYQFAGTRYNYADSNDASAKIQLDNHTPPPPAGGKPRPTQEELKAALPPELGTSRTPSKLRLLLRGLQLVAAIGHLGFAAGASPFSDEDVPLDETACFYFLFAVAALTIVWSFFHLSWYCYRRIGHGPKINRVIMTGTDLLLAILWGIGTIVEIAMYRCPPGGYNHWCDFYNVSIFWGMLSFVLFLTAVGWDLVGACIARRK